MKKSATDSFVLTMPFRYEPWQRDCLDKAFRIAGGIYNSLVANRKKALEQLEKTKAWRANQRALRAAYETEGSGSGTEVSRYLTYSAPPGGEALYCLTEKYGICYTYHVNVSYLIANSNSFLWPTTWPV